jgi:hypothetical protein
MCLHAHRLRLRVSFARKPGMQPKSCIFPLWILFHAFLAIRFCGVMQLDLGALVDQYIAAISQKQVSLWRAEWGKNACKEAEGAVTRMYVKGECVLATMRSTHVCAL